MRTILIAGATGLQGRSLISALKPRDASLSEFQVLGLTRQPNSPSAKALSSSNPHVRLVQGDLDKPETVRKIFEDEGGPGAIYGVFCVLAFPGLGKEADGEEKQGTNLADIAMEFKVQHYVFSSYERGGTSLDHTLTLDRKAKLNIEKHLIALGDRGLPWTILRIAFFMENFMGQIGRLTGSILRVGLKEDTKVNLVAVKDIGNVAAAVYHNPEKTRGKILSITSDLLTASEMVSSYKNGTGKDMPSVPDFIARTLLRINTHARGVITDMERVHGLISNPPDNSYAPTQALADGIYPHKTTFEQWSREAMSSPKESADETPRQGWNGVKMTGLIRGKH